MKKTAIIIASTILFSICLTSCNSDPFASANGSYENVRWDIRDTEETTGKMALYTLGSDAEDIMIDSKKIKVRSDVLDMKPIAELSFEVGLEEYLQKRHDLDDKTIESVNTTDYIDNASGVFYSKAHLYTIKNEAAEYGASRFLVLEQSFQGFPVKKLPYNNTSELIKWDGHIYWTRRGVEKYFRSDDLILMYDDWSYPWENAVSLSAEFEPIKPVQGIETVVNTLISRHGDTDSINVFAAELCYVMANEWMVKTGTEDSMGKDLYCIPLWKYDYSLEDTEGNTTDMGSVFLRADTGALADLWDDKIVAQIHSPG